MEETLVSLETAKLLKEKGFNEPCYDYYIEKQEGTFHSNDTLLQNGTLFITALAPTQSLAQKWLREKHNIHIWIENYPDYDKYFFQCPQLADVEVEGKIDHYGNTYEECLEKCLIEALKLIK